MIEANSAEIANSEECLVQEFSIRRGADN